MAQLINITSEALQATIRRLLPSQQGFGEDLQATNVVTPIIDLTPTAEGSVLGVSLQQALNFGGNTSFEANGSTKTIASTPGFYRVTGTVTVRTDPGANRGFQIAINDGLATKIMYRAVANSGAQEFVPYDFDQVYFLTAGDTLQITTDSNCIGVGSARQIATVTGELVNPVGYVSQ